MPDKPKSGTELIADLSVLLDSCGQPFSIGSLDGRIVACNDAFCRLVGYDRDELLGKDWRTDLTPPKWRCVTQEVIERISATGEAQRYQKEYQRKDRSRVPVEILLQRDPVGENDPPYLWALVTDITERRNAETALRESEKKYRALFREMSEGFAVHEIIRDENGMPCDYRFLEVNPAFEAQTGLKAPEVVEKTLRQVMPGAEEYWVEIYGRVALTGRPASFQHYSRDLGRYYQVLAYRTGTGRFATLFLDVTEQRRFQLECETTLELLRLVNESTSLHDLVRASVLFFQHQSRCEAVGIRLCEGDDYPYYESRGFPQEFLLTENTLCTLDDSVNVVRNETGEPVIECMCGNVICGRFDPSKPFFTEAGSFWTDSTTELLATTTEEDRMGRTRNRCNTQGYESLALIPLRVGEEHLGLLQFNDRREGVFSPEDIELWERLAGHLAVAIAKHRAEEELRNLASLPEENPDPVMRITSDGEIIYANKAGEALLAAWDAQAGGDGTGERLRTVRNVLKSGSVNKVEVLCGERIMSLVLAPVAEKDYANVYGRDITDRKKADERIRESERKYRELVDGAHEGILTVDADGRTTYVNPRLAQMLGYTAEEMLGRPLSHFGDDKGVAIIARNLERRRQGISDAFDFEFVRKDGSRFYANVSASPLADQDGNFIGALGFISDITDRKTAETETAARIFWEGIASTMGSGLVITDLDGTITYVNGAFCRLTGRDYRDLVGSGRDYDWWTAEPSDDDAVLAYNVFDADAVEDQSGFVLHSSGARIPALINVSVLTDPTGAPFARLAVIQDTSELVETQERLARRERLAMIGQLAGSIGHEIRNPLGVIQSSVYYLRTKLDGRDEKIMRHLDRLDNSVAFADKVVTDLLSFSRMPRLRRKQVDLSHLIRAILDESPEDPTITVSCAAEGNTSAWVDEVQMTQLFRNLLSNAVDAMPDGGKLSVRLSGDSYAVRTAICDSGEGIPEGNLEKVFEPLYSTKARGAGFGLAICRRIVESHSGSISILSKPSAGTEVTVTLPTTKEEDHG